MSDDALDAAASSLGDRLHEPPEIFIVLGSGLGGVTDAVEAAVSFPFTEIPGLPPSAVEGHAGRFVAGRLGGRPVLIQSGRYHAYEGHPRDVIVAPVRIAHRVGAESLLVTNAAGGIREGLAPGTIVAIRDHLNLHFVSPLRGRVRAGEIRFPSMTEAYAPALRAHARRIAAELEIPLEEGVYASLAGPTYETPAEVRMLRTLGADTVGMSTVPEVIVARARSMRVLGFSLVTNLAAGLGEGRLDHAEVMEEGRKGGRVLGRLLREVVRRWNEIGAPA
ncbi:MAG: purine-nucleoside phosphorylase [Longimicrobiales bacterium]|nr:purine-nucleoside phosphorylase [Longimicrobiales bacterium]